MKKSFLALVLMSVCMVSFFGCAEKQSEKSMQDYITEYQERGENYYLLGNASIIYDYYKIEVPRTVSDNHAYPMNILFIGDFSDHEIRTLMSDSVSIIVEFENARTYRYGHESFESFFYTLDGKPAAIFLNESPFLKIVKNM